MKTILFITFLFLFQACKTLDVKGDTVYQIYPQDNYAEEMVIAESCPVLPSEPVTISILDPNLQGVVCIPEAQAMEYRRKHNKECQDRLIEQRKNIENNKNKYLGD